MKYLTPVNVLSTLLFLFVIALLIFWPLSRLIFAGVFGGAAIMAVMGYLLEAFFQNKWNPKDWHYWDYY